MLGDWIEELVTYGVRTGLTPECERIYTRNLLLDCFEEPDFATSEGEDAAKSERPLVDILNDLLEEAVRRGKIGDSVTERDLFDTKLMNCLMPRPAQVREEFAKHYAESPKEATDWFYAFSQNSNYIRRDRIAKDRKWKVDSSYGPIDITINLSKPEKIPVPLQQPVRQRVRAIRCASSAWKMKAMQAGSTTRHEKITVSYR